MKILQEMSIQQSWKLTVLKQRIILMESYLMEIDVRSILNVTLECAIKRLVLVKDLLRENFVLKQ